MNYEYLIFQQSFISHSTSWQPNITEMNSNYQHYFVDVVGGWILFFTFN